MTATGTRLAVAAAAFACLATIGACAPAAPAPSSAAGTDASHSSGAPAAAVPLLIDTDVATDDLVAIAFLVASPNVDVRAITVSGTGEAHCQSGVAVVLRLLERLDAPQIPVACGRETPIAGSHAFPDAWRERVDAGSGLDLAGTARQPDGRDAVQLLSDTSKAVDGLRILTLGPLTNLADALDRDPTLRERIESVHVMGGALFVPGNVSFGGPPDNKVAEWNVYVDPTAVQRVVDSGVPLRFTSLDGTSQVPVTGAFAQRVHDEASAPGARVLADLFEANPFMTDGSYFLWDPLAAEMAAGYPVGSFKPARIAVDVAEGPEAGFTRPVDGAPNVEYLSSADGAAAEKTLLETLNGGG